MDVLLDQLTQLLNQEAGLYESMAAVIDKEKDAAIRTELSRLIETRKEKENILLKLRIMEDQRTRIVVKVADDLGYLPHDLTLTKISQLVDDPYAKRLKDCSAKLSFLIGRLQEANRNNRQLFEHSLDLLRGSFNLLNDLMEANPVYHRTGNIQNSNSTGRLVYGEI
ncbi:MAG: flagellar protein FlgN [Desulfobacterales bacterium]|jgi:flagellar biosynthesis/type III secretory pathway chaperone